MLTPEAAQFACVTRTTVQTLKPEELRASAGTQYLRYWVSCYMSIAINIAPHT